MRLTNHFIEGTSCIACRGNELAPNEQVVMMPLVYLTGGKGESDKVQLHLRCYMMLEPMMYYSEGDSTQIQIEIHTPSGMNRHDVISEGA